MSCVQLSKSYLAASNATRCDRLEIGTGGAHTGDHPNGPSKRRRGFATWLRRCLRSNRWRFLLVADSRHDECCFRWRRFPRVGPYRGTSDTSGVSPLHAFPGTQFRSRPANRLPRLPPVPIVGPPLPATARYAAGYAVPDTTASVSIPASPT